MIPSPAPPGSPTAWIFPREFGFAARPNGDHFSEGFRAQLRQASRPAILFPREFAFLASATRLPQFSERFSSPAPRPLPSEGFCFHRWLTIAPSPRDFAFTAWLTGRPFIRGISSPAPPGFPTAYTFPRDFASTAWLTGRPFSEGFRARHRQAPRPLHFSEGFCFHRSAHRSTTFRGISSQAPRPLTFFRGILLPSLGSPVAPFPRDFEPGTARLPDRLHVSEGFCFHRLAHRSPLLRGI